MSDKSNGKQPLLEIDSLVKYFPIKAGVFRKTVAHVKAVDDVSFKVFKGETLGLVGESGCGKTTAGMSLLRLYEPTSGRVLMSGKDTTYYFLPALKARKYIKTTYTNKFNDLKSKAGSAEKAIEGLDKDIDKEMARLYFETHNGSESAFIHDLMSNREAKRKEFRRQAQMIFQDPFSSLNPRMRVKNIVGEGAKIHGLAQGNEVKKMTLDILKKVGLSEDHLNRFPHEFSGGQRQRVGIARALILNPDLIVCDEAVSALDVSIQAQILNLLNDLQKEFKLTFVFIDRKSVV